MEFWEFLLQKEGDRSWLPLESSKVEILEGRYRLVARSSSVNIPVEIRIIHDATMEIPPVRRTQKRTSRTNKDGLVVIIPFTRLLPGVWELRCTSDLMSEMLGEGWQHSVQLQVESQAIEADWEPDWDGHVTAAEAVAAGAADAPLPTTAVAEVTTSDRLPLEQDGIAVTDAPGHVPDPVEPEPIAPLASASDLLPLTPRTAETLDPRDQFAGAASDATLDATLVRNSSVFQQAEQLSEEVVEAAFDELGVELNPIASTSNTPSTLQPNRLPTIRLRLGQDTHIVQRGQPLALVGQVEHAAGLLTDEIAVSELQIRLYDPRNSQVLVDQRQPLAPRRLPFPFSCQIALPDTHQTYLLLGEVVLYAASADAPIEVATQTFTVTTDLHELLESIANDFTEPDLPPPPSAPLAAEPVQPNVAFLNLPGVAQSNLQFRPSVPQPLPPQLRPIEPPGDERSRKVPELPTFAKTNALQGTGEVTATATEVDVSPDQLAIDAIPDLETTDLETTDLETTDLETTDLETTEVSQQPASSDEMPIEQTLATAIPSAAALNKPPVSPQAFDDADPIADWYKDEFLSEPNQQQVTGEQRSASPADRAFQALNLQERFWARLQSLMTDQELSDWLRRSESGEAMAGVAAAGGSVGSAVGQSKGRSRPFSGGLDAALAAQEVVAEDALTPNAPATSGRGSPDSEAPSQMLVLPIDQPIPMPQLEPVTKELIAGQSFSTAVRLPNLPARLMVKLWLRDRQSRTLLSGPHWLVDFTPDGFGNQIIRTELTVPRGCLEVQLEAITLEVPTQRESDKATLMCEVVPPDLSSFSLDDFDI